MARRASQHRGRGHVRDHEGDHRQGGKDLKRLAACLALSVCLQAELTRKAYLDATASTENGKTVLRRVLPDGNAARAGLHDGDVVVEIDRNPVMRVEVGGKRVFTIEREGKQKKIEVVYQAGPKENPRDLLVEYSTVTVDGHQRRTLITVPLGGRRHDAFLLLAGSGCGRQESPHAGDPVTQVLYELTRRGFVTMRVEKTGAGDSDGPPCYSEQGGMMQEVEGYRAGFAALAAHGKVKGKRIFLLGHSAGGTLAPMVAKGLDVAGIVAVGAMGTSFFDYILEMRRREALLGGMTEEQAGGQVALTKACLTRLWVGGETADAIEKSDPRCRKRVRFDSPPKYVEDWYKLNLSEAWVPVKAPVLVIYGSGDFVTSERESQALVDRINTGNAGQAHLSILPMDHGFLAHATPERAWRAEQGIVTPEGLAMKAVDAIAAFAGRDK